MGLKLLVLLAVAFSIGAAELSIIRGRVLSSGATIEEVEGVVALALGGMATGSQFLDCTGTGVTATNLEWRRENGMLAIPIQTRSNAKRLDFSNALYSDEGIYTCRNSSSEQSVSINVTGASLAICPAEGMYSVQRGSTALLKVFTSGIPAVTDSEITWYDPRNKKIPSSSRQSLVESNKALRITSVGVEDFGMYTIAISRHIFGSVFLNASTMITLNVQVPPTVESGPMEMTVLEHEDVTLTCVFSGSPRPTITWEREGDSLPAMARTTTRYSPSRNDTTGVYTVESRYTISGVFVTDAGRYRCSANSEAVSNPVVSSYAQINIMPRLQLSAIVGTSNKAIPESRLLSIDGGTRVTITCRGSGNLSWSSSSGVPIPSFTGSTTGIYQRRDITTSIQELTIQPFGTTYQSEYTCSNLNNADISESILLANSFTIYIPPSTIYTSPGANANITAVFYIASAAAATITWFFNGMQIDTAGSARYSTVRVESTEILRVVNVDEGVLGDYMVMISSEGANQSDTVILAFPEPPTSSATPTELSVNEGGGARFTCVAGGTLTTQRWVRRNGGGTVVLSESEQLDLTSVTRSNAGSYICEVFGQYGGIHSSTVTLNVNYPPTIEVIDGMTMASADQVLQVNRLDGDAASTFSCRSDGFPQPTITWSKEGGLPVGVISRSSSSEQILEWNRNLEYTDSGTYTCIAQNGLNTSMGTLNLLVKRPPVVTSIFATSPVQSTSRYSFSVPNGYSRNILTCSGLAWPPPQIEWVKGNISLTGGRVSATGQNPYVSATLALPQGETFGEEDVGNYSCIVWGRDGNNEFHVETVTLTLNTGIVSTDPPAPKCVANSVEVKYQLRVLGADCENILSSHSEIIARETQSELLNVVNTECSSCLPMADSVTISVMPSCSQEVEGAILFTGSISTGSAETTESVFCALDKWVQSSPLIRVSNALHKVDDTCVLSSGGSSTECALASTTTDQGTSIVISMTLLIGICAGGGGLVCVIVLIGVICCCCCCSSRRKKGEVELKRPDPYERTSYMERSRYTAQINPEDNPDLDSPPPVYSTLENTVESVSFMHPPRNSSDLTTNEIEMMPFRRESEQHLINGRMFQVVQSSVPQPYQEAVSSMENLDQVGVVPSSGYNSTITAGRTSSASNTSSSQQTSSAFMDQTPPLGLSDRLMMPAHAPISIANRVASKRAMSESSQVSTPTSKIPEYEIVTTRANASHASSSPRLLMPSGRVTSAGVARPPPPAGAGPVRRYKSELVGGNAQSGYVPYDEEDYENLDEPASAGPHSIGIRRGSGQVRIGEGRALGRQAVGRGGRGLTLPSSATSMSSASVLPGNRPAFRKASLPEKRVSVTSYSRGSPVDSRASVSSSINKLPLSPVEQMPPSYREAILSDASMVENEAYQTADAARQVQVQHRVVRSPESAQDGGQRTDRYWYRNSSPSIEDITVPKESKGSTRMSLTPYSQVSNLEIDARRPEDRSQGHLRDHRNFLHSTEPVPYAEPVSSVEDLTKVARSKQSFPKMVLV